jgi:2-methylcitrate dehydratase PrpD
VVGAEAYGKSGEELLTAAILGYEIYQRFTMGASGNIVGNNVFAAIVVLARLLDLDEEQINKAFGIATACAILPVNVHEETMSDALNYLYGLKVDGAFTQALTALQGVYNQEDALDDPTAFTAHMQQQQPEWLTRDLGEEFYLNDILVKKWPANYYVQTYAEIAYRLQKKHHIDPERIESVILEPAFARRFWFSDTGFQSLTHAQFSIPYVVAAVLYYPDEPGERWYQPETLENPKVVTLMNKVTATSFIKERRPLSSKNYNRLKAWQPKKYITIRLQDGREFKDGLYTQPGDTSYMFSREEFEDFFRQRTRPVLSSVKTEKIIAFLADLEHQPDASLLPQYLY